MAQPNVTAKQFNQLAQRAFETILNPVGFSSVKSGACTFSRKTGDDIWHFVRPVQSVRLLRYEVWIFAHSPRIEPSFQALFPDDLSPPNDAWCKLHSSEGVGLSQEWFSCRTEEGFLREFVNRVEPALRTHAVPYLDRIVHYDDLIPHIRSRYYRQQAGLS